MLSVDYDEEKGGWQELKIIPYAPFEISPADKVYTMVKLYLKV